MRKPTSLTRVLQIGLPAFFDVGWLVVWIIDAPYINSDFVPGGTTYRGNALLTELIGTSVLFALLTVGSARRWRWTFWGYLVLLFGGALLSAVQGLHTAFDWVATLIGVVLLLLSAFSAVRYGPWAMEKTSSRVS